MATKKTTPKVSSSKKSARPADAAKRPAQGPPAKTAPKGLSALGAAERVLQETRKAMNCKAMIEAMAAKGYWKSPGGKTPASTLYAAILRELSVKGKQARFKKTERGKFALA